MTHGEAQREMSVERYLLGELQGDARDDFEDHLFGCELCSSDLQAGLIFTEGIKASGPRLVTKPAIKPVNGNTAPERRMLASGWLSSLLQPWIAVPAMAACLGVIGVQSFVIQPRLHRELAEAQMPAVVSGLTLSSTRSLGASEVQAHAGGGFLISVDIPAESRFRAYRCTLVSPVAKPVWHTYLSPAQVNDTVVIHVPVGSTASGVNVLKVEGIPQAEGGQAVSLLQRSFNLKIGE